MAIIETTEGLRFQELITYPQIRMEENRFTFITGESGSGKSTYLKLLNKTLLPSAGEVRYRGQNIREGNTLELRRRVLLVPQEVFLFDGTIRDNFAAYYASREETPPGDDLIRSVLQVCCADFPLEAQCAVLSGGERQRVFQAIFLSLAPDVLLLDEPTAALDETTGRQLLGNIKGFCSQRKITGVVVSHNDELTRQFADQIIELKRGEVQ